MRIEKIEDVRRSEKGFLGGDGDGRHIHIQRDEDEPGLASRRWVLSVMTRGMGTRDMVFDAGKDPEYFADMVADGRQNGLQFDLPGSMVIIPADLVRESLFSVRRED